MEATNALFLPFVASVFALLPAASAQVVDWKASGNGGAVTAGGSEAVEAGALILEQNGNAFDAAAATLCAQAVADFGKFAFGGEVPIILYDAKKSETKTLSGVGKAPSDVSWYLAHGIRLYGHLRAAAPPGAIHAILTMLKLYGTMSFEVVVQPMRALLVEQSGTRHFSNLLNTINRMIRVERNAPGGREAAIDAVIDDVYGLNGQIAQTLVRYYKRGGHFITANDLASQTTLIENPVTINYTSGSGEMYEILKCNTWTQGPTLSQTLKLLEGFDLQNMTRLSADYIHVLTEALKLAFADRDIWYGDPNFANVPISELVSQSYADIRRPLIDQTVASLEQQPGDPNNMQPLLKNRSRALSGSAMFVPDTTTCVVTDRHGNMVVATPSCNVFGYSKDGGSTGITHGNRLRCFNTANGHPNMIQPGKRPRITLSPTMVLKGGKPILGISVAGGDIQEQTSLNALLNVLEFGMLPEEAVSTPRFMTEHRENSFNPTPDRTSAFGIPGSLQVNTAIPFSVRNDLASRGHKLTNTSTFIGRPCALFFDWVSGISYAAGDSSANRHAASFSVSDGSILSEEFESGTGSFTYINDAFGTSAPAYASGSYDSSGALRVDLGGIDDSTIKDMSGGWQTTFTLSLPTDVVFSFRYKLTQTPNYETDEFSRVLASLDETQLGRGSSDFVEEVVGDGNGGSSISTGWRIYSSLLGLLQAGTHTLTLGGYNNKKTRADESTVVLIDSVSVGYLGPPPDPSLLAAVNGTVRSGSTGMPLDATVNVDLLSAAQFFIFVISLCFISLLYCAIPSVFPCARKRLIARQYYGANQ